MNVAGLSQNNIYLAIIKYKGLCCRDKLFPTDIRKQTYLKDLETKMLEIQKLDSHSLKTRQKRKVNCKELMITIISPLPLQHNLVRIFHTQENVLTHRGKSSSSRK